MPSASRYLATVRRATCTPSAASSSTICWSDSGLSGASWAISLRILARIAVDETPVPSSAGHVAREKEAELEHAARRVQVLAGRHARDRRLVHLDGLGDVLQDHRLHGLLAAVEEGLLALDDRARDPEHRVVADLEAAEQPARLLQLRAQHRVVRRARDHAGVALVHPDARQADGLSSTDQPWGVRRAKTSGTTYSGAQRLERGAGARVAAANQRERDVELLAADVHLALQGGELLAGHQLEMPVGEGARRGEAGSRGVELRELQLDALGDGARADAGRIELLDDREHAQRRPRRRSAPRLRPLRRSPPAIRSGSRRR